MGDSIANCRKAIDLIAEIPKVCLFRTSSFYRTEPLGYTKQDWYVNAAVEIRTAISPAELLKAVHGIEEVIGRNREEESVRWGPRIADVDILLYGLDIINENDLVIPHPELHRRRFVLAPLAEIASRVIHPVFGVTIKCLLDKLGDQGEVFQL